MEAKNLTLACSDGKSVYVPPKCAAMCTLLTSMAEDFPKTQVPLEFSSHVMQAFVDALSVKNYPALISQSLYHLSDYFGLTNLRELLVQRRNNLVAAKCRAFFSTYKDMIIDVYEKKGDYRIVDGKPVKYMYIDLRVTDFLGDELLLKVKKDSWPDGEYIFVYPLGIRNREETNDSYTARVNLIEIENGSVRLDVDVRKTTCCKVTFEYGRISVSM